MVDKSEQSRYRLPTEFQRLFAGQTYFHRKSTQGDFVAIHLFEDLFAIGRSPKFIAAVERRERVVNTRNIRRGIKARRGDGTFGEIIPGETAVIVPGYVVGRGPIASVEIGVEVKILAKAMIKQIDRVINDLRNQVTQFRRGGGKPICVGIVGINQADYCVSYEGDRTFRTTGHGSYLHPIQEAAEAEKRLRLEAAPVFDEFLVLRFRATNEAPFPFEWVSYKETRLDYAAALARIGGQYQERFL